VCKEKYYIKMAEMIVAFRVMPVDGEVEYSDLESAIKGVVEAYADGTTKIKSIASEAAGFGMEACAFEIQLDEKYGCEPLENSLDDLEVTGNVAVTKMDRL
jgi:translation elongation factor EF-1beta